MRGIIIRRSVMVETMECYLREQTMGGDLDVLQIFVPEVGIVITPRLEDIFVTNDFALSDYAFEKMGEIEVPSHIVEAALNFFQARERLREYKDESLLLMEKIEKSVVD